MPDNGKTRLTLADVVPGASTARAGKLGGNPYLPEIATVVEIIPETPNIKTFRMRFDDPAVQEKLSEPNVLNRLLVNAKTITLGASAFQTVPLELTEIR